MSWRHKLLNYVTGSKFLKLRSKFHRRRRELPNKYVEKYRQLSRACSKWLEIWRWRCPNLSMPSHRQQVNPRQLNFRLKVMNLFVQFVINCCQYNKMKLNWPKYSNTKHTIIISFSCLLWLVILNKNNWNCRFVISSVHCNKICNHMWYILEWLTVCRWRNFETLAIDILRLRWMRCFKTLANIIVLPIVSRYLIQQRISKMGKNGFYYIVVTLKNFEFPPCDSTIILITL